jgi:hypothetical protein
VSLSTLQAAHNLDGLRWARDLDGLRWDISNGSKELWDKLDAAYRIENCDINHIQSTFFVNGAVRAVGNFPQAPHQHGLRNPSAGLQNKHPLDVPDHRDQGPLALHALQSPQQELAEPHGGLDDV